MARALSSWGFNRPVAEFNPECLKLVPGTSIEQLLVSPQMLFPYTSPGLSGMHRQSALPSSQPHVSHTSPMSHTICPW